MKFPQLVSTLSSGTQVDNVMAAAERLSGFTDPPHGVRSRLKFSENRVRHLTTSSTTSHPAGAIAVAPTLPNIPETS